jgi:RNA polymerase sigma factor (sigma-70 family)
MIPTDTQLLGRAQAGDIEALCELVERHRTVALRVGYAIVGAEAEDVVQEAFVRAARSLDGFRSGAPFRPWLLTIVANEARNRRRSTSRREALQLRVAHRDAADGSRLPDARSTEEIALANEQRRWLLRAVAGLSDRDREVIALRYFADLSEAETASALECPVGTVKSRLARALGRLRAALGAEVVT